MRCEELLELIYCFERKLQVAIRLCIVTILC